jgi:hypothetical protein
LTNERGKIKENANKKGSMFIRQTGKLNSRLIQLKAIVA